MVPKRVFRGGIPLFFFCLMMTQVSHPLGATSDSQWPWEKRMVKNPFGTMVFPCVGVRPTESRVARRPIPRPKPLPPIEADIVDDGAEVLEEDPTVEIAARESPKRPLALTFHENLEFTGFIQSELGDLALFERRAIPIGDSSPLFPGEKLTEIQPLYLLFEMGDTKRVVFHKLCPAPERQALKKLLREVFTGGE